MKSLLKLRLIVVLPIFGVLILLSVLVFMSEDADSVNISRCIPTFQDGGGPYYKSGSPFREKIVPNKNNGEKLVVEGVVLLKDCQTPVEGAVLDIWQANESGSYEDEFYRGQITTGKNGKYRFETVVPRGYGEGTAFRPPHIHFKVFIEGKEIITSQLFFPEAKGKPGFDDAYIMSLKTRNVFGKNTHHGYHPIILPI